MTTIESLERFTPLSTASRALIIDSTVLIEVPKHTQLVAAGDICTDAYFVEKGLARVYCQEKKYNEMVSITSWFAQEGGVLSSIDSFLTQKPSNEYIEIIEDCTLRVLPHVVLKEIWEEQPDICKAFIRLYEQYIMVYERRIHKLMRIKDPVLRYLFFLKLYPTLVNRISLKYIASYLDMSAETLSRVRREIMEKKLL